MDGFLTEERIPTDNNTLRGLIESALGRAASEGASGGANDREISIVLELDRQQFARAVYRLNDEETRRVGTRLSTGGDFDV